MVHGRAVLVIGPSGDWVPLPDDGELTIGRDPSNDIMVDSSTVSRRHALVRSTADGWLLMDAGSSNGTYVNGTLPVTAEGTVVGVRTHVRFGDVIGEIRSATHNDAPASGVARRYEGVRQLLPSERSRRRPARRGLGAARHHHLGRPIGTDRWR